MRRPLRRRAFLLLLVVLGGGSPRSGPSGCWVAGTLRFDGGDSRSDFYSVALDVVHSDTEGWVDGAAAVWVVFPPTPFGREAPYIREGAWLLRLEPLERTPPPDTSWFERPAGRTVPWMRVVVWWPLHGASVW